MITRSTPASRCRVDRLAARRSSWPTDARSPRLQARARIARFPTPSWRAATPARRECSVAARRRAASSANEQQRQDLHRLAEAHIVGEAGTETERGQEVEPADAGLLVRAQCRLERLARIDVRQRFGTAESFERLREPGTGHDAGPLGRDGVAATAAETFAPASMRIASAKPSPFSAAVSSTARNSPSIRPSLSRSTSTQRPRTKCRPFESASRASISAAVKRSPSSVTSIWKSSSASVPSPAGGCPPTVAVTCGRCGRLPRHVPGTRTTTPADSSRGTSVRSWNASVDVHRSGWKISPASTIVFSQGH